MLRRLIILLLIVGCGGNNIKCHVIVRDVSYDNNGEVTYSETAHVYEERGEYDAVVEGDVYNVDSAERECARYWKDRISSKDSTLAFNSCDCWEQNDRFYNLFGD